MSEFPGLETLEHGVKDFGQEIIHDLEDIVPHHDRQSKEFQESLPKDPHSVQVQEARPGRILMRTIVLQAGPFEVTNMARYSIRDSILITVQSGNPIAVSDSDRVSLGHLTTGGPSVAIPVSVARKFLYTGPLWVIGQAGTVIDVVIESYTNE